MEAFYTKYSIEEIQNKLKNCLTNERYIHSLGVMEAAGELALRFNCNIEKAKIAGILHDCAKCIPHNELENYSYCLSDCEKLNIKTWHAPIGAVIAKNEYDISDKEILSAIRWHTIGKIDMSIFEKIIFIADKIEKRTRDKDISEDIENALNRNNNPDDAMLECFKITINSLLKRNLSVCYQTIDVYNHLLPQNGLKH